MLSLNFRDKKLNVVKKYWVFVIISAVIILAGLVDALFVRHMNFGVEFSGGINVQVSVSGSNANLETTVENFLAGKETEYSKTQYVVDGEPQKSGTGLKTVTYRLKPELKDGTDLNVTDEGASDSRLVIHSNEIKENLTELLEAKGFTGVEVEPHVIGNDVKNYTIRNAAIAVAVAVVVILAYIAIRFNLLAGVSAIIALIHDVLIMIAFTTILQIPVNMTFIAAVITIIGYSINATIVVFDRIREIHVLPSNLEKTDAEIAESAVKSTLSRSILTTLTTLVMITCLAIFGNSSIREFAFPIMFGLVAGLYSSVLLSASTWVKLRKLFKQENKKPVKKARKVKEAKA